MAFRVPRLIVPKTLRATLLAASVAQCSTSPSPGDGATRDVVAHDTLVDALFDSGCDAQPMPGGNGCLFDPSADVIATCPIAVCAAVQCPLGCLFCPLNADGDPGVFCASPTSADGGGATCPNTQVCTASACPAGCSVCGDALFCVPTEAGVACARTLTCDPGGCGPGCEAEA